MDHAAAAREFDGLAESLANAGGHLVGPGHDFTRRALARAAGHADRLADIHRAAVSTALAREYVADLLDPVAPPR